MGVGNDRVLIGAFLDDTGAFNAGAAYLFRTNGFLLTTFTNPAPVASDFFGRSFAEVGGDKLLISAFLADTGAVDAGVAYLFSTNGTLLTTFTNPIPANGGSFGRSVAGMGSDRVLIGANLDNTGAVNSGVAYLFSINGTLLTTFTNPTPALNDNFGFTVAAVGNDKVLIGAYGDNTGANSGGAAYLFSTNGTLLRTMTNPSPAASDNFAFSLAVLGSDKIIIGAGQDDTGAVDSGAAYLYVLTEYLAGFTLDASSLLSGTVDEARLGANVALRSGGNFFTGEQVVNAGNVSVNSGDLFVNTGNMGVGTFFPGGKLDVRGNIRLGNGGQLHAPGGVESLRVIRGIVSTTGSILSGQGYSVTRTGVGSYTITFTTTFADVPVVTITAQSGLARMATVTNVAFGSAQVRTFDAAGVLVDAQFHFTAIGLR